MDVVLTSFGRSSTGVVLCSTEYWSTFVVRSSTGVVLCSTE